MKKLNIWQTAFIFGTIVLAGISICLISISSQYEGFTQTLLVSIGTGLLSSAIVSFAFWVIQHIVDVRKKEKQRYLFMKQIRILFYNMLYDINWSPLNDTTLELNEYIKAQHRWFHDYYKRLVADNGSDSETNQRIKQIKKFNETYSLKMKNIFDGRVVWEESNFTDWQLSELSSLYDDFCECVDYIAQNEFQCAFLFFASFLEVLMRILCKDKFVELNNFACLKYVYDSNGKLKRIDDEFYEKEPDFKFAKDFNAIRYSNYRKYYGKDTKQEQNNG